MDERTGVRRAVVRRAPVALAVVAGILFAGTPVDASSGWPAALGAGSGSEAAAGTRPGAPAAPVASCVARAKATIHITWSAVPHATGYTVLAFPTGTLTGTTEATITATTWTSVFAAGTYRFEVLASAGNNWASPASSPTTALSINGGGHCS